jgi:hypothetical protein
MNDHESPESTQMVMDDQNSYTDQHTLKKTIDGQNPDITKLPSSSIKKQQLNSTTITQQQKPKRDYELPPLILEGVNLSRVALNNFLVKKVPDLKCNNIVYNDKSRNFTIYPSTIASFNALLTRLPMAELSDTARIFVPRSIQRIQKTDTEAFVKGVDKDLSENDIQNALIRNGYQVNQVERLMNKEKTDSGTTIKIAFGDIKNRDTFVKLGLQIDHMHFSVEKAKHKIVPQQCYSCYRYGHIAKYCKQSSQICYHCTGSHRYEVCDQKQQQPKCCNCQGSHEATSHECPRYKEEQKRLQSAIDRYSHSSVDTHSYVPVPSGYDIMEYPALSAPSSMNTKIQNNIIEACTAATTAAIERISEQLVAKFTKKLEEITHQILSKLQLPVDLIMDSHSRDFNSSLNRKEEKKDYDCLLQISDLGQLSNIDDGETAEVESNHTSNAHQTTRSTISNTNGIKRSSNIESPTSHQPKRTNNKNQNKATKTTKTANNTLII